MAKMVLGAQLYSVRQSIQTIPDIAETFEKVKAMGYKTVQISAMGPVDPKEVAKISEDTGIEVAATHFGWDRFLNDLDALIEEHKLWKCRHPAIGGLFADEYKSADGIKRFLDELAPVAERLAAEGMDFSYHNHNHEFGRVGEKTMLKTLLEESDPKHLNFEIDTYWVQAGGGDPAEWLRKCAGRIPIIHFKDMIATLDGKQRFAEIGEGNLNWPAIIEAAEAGGTEYCFIEQDDCYDRDPFESLAISYRNLHAMGLS
ncbi:MAG: sugar phosphate isomerase/epimerase [Phycisphaerae bacterium]|jgi:sugar phosphate isomerase/epimerase|nr:sugar phosphate isomerase/epimerase [Phycisphaerae bacterium]